MIKKLFVAVFIPKDLQLLLEEKVAAIFKLWPKSSDIQLIRPEDYHFTIFYLGRQEEGSIPGIIEAIKSAIKNCRPSPIEISNISYPDNNPERGMIWANGRSEAMNKMRDKLWQELESRHIPFEEKRRVNKAHINLARFHAENYEELPDVDALVQKNFIGSTICLVESKPTLTGSIYSIVSSIDLKHFQE